MVFASDKLPIALLLVNKASDRVFFKRVLAQEYYVLEASDALDALEKIVHGRVSVVLTHDKLHQMPIESFCKKIREIDRLKDLPVLIYTSNLKKSYVKELLTAGATDFLREPLNDEEVYNRISIAVQAQALKKKMSPLAQTIHKSSRVPESKKLEKTRFALRDHAVRVIKEALHDKESLSLLLVSIDHYEKIKSRWGELALEELLDLFETHLKTCIRHQDILMHATHERFIIILPKTSFTAAKIIAEEIKESFKEQKFKTKKAAVRLTLSIGLTSLDKNRAEISDAYDYLDAMLKDGEDYLLKAKQVGNRIVSK